MFVRKTRPGHRARPPFCLCLLSICGCGLAGDTGDRPRSTLNLSTLVEQGGTSTIEETGSNNLLEGAEPVATSSEPQVILGRIAGPDDVDVYDLGPVQPGERVVVDVTTEDTLNGAIALFDDHGAALLINDHRNVYLGEKGPFIDLVLRRPSSSCYVAMSGTPGFGAHGEYGLVASRQAGAIIPQPRGDSVLLVFSGGANVAIGNRPAIEVPPFDGANIDTSLAGHTAELIAGIVAGVRQDYAGFHLTVSSTSEGDRFDGSMTRIFFGTFDPALLGVAEGVDEYDAHRGQQAIVFTDTFEAFMPLRPSVQEMSQAIANVASHEIGHLLGLVHTADPQALMDVTASLNDLLEDQIFRNSPIHSQVFPLGYQDSVQCLLDAVGGDPSVIDRESKRATERRQRVIRPANGLSGRSQVLLSSCGLDAD